MTRNNRVEFLEKLVSTGKADSFARYALALEYEKSNRADEALAAFVALRQSDPDYLPMYFMAGQLLSRLGQVGDAGEWLRAGIALAQEKGDSKAYSELSGLLAELLS